MLLLIFYFTTSVECLIPVVDNYYYFTQILTSAKYLAHVPRLAPTLMVVSNVLVFKDMLLTTLVQPCVKQLVSFRTLHINLFVTVEDLFISSDYLLLVTMVCLFINSDCLLLVTMVCLYISSDDLLWITVVCLLVPMVC